MKYQEAIGIARKRASEAPPTTGDTSQPIVGFTGETGSIYRMLPRTVSTGSLWTPGGDWPQWDRVKSQEQQIMHEERLGKPQPRYMKPRPLTLWTNPTVKKMNPQGFSLNKKGLKVLSLDDMINKVRNDKDIDYNKIIEDDFVEMLIATNRHGTLAKHNELWSHMPRVGWDTHEFDILRDGTGSIAYSTHRGHPPVTIHHGSLPEGSDDLFKKYQGTDLLW
jgi:hypothetical protein